MIALTIIDNFNHQRLTYHNIIGLEVEMNDVTLLEIANTLDYHEENIYFGEEGSTRSMKIEILHYIRHEKLV